MKQDDAGSRPQLDARTPTPPQPRAAATRQALLQAGGSQFAAAGYSGASLREIVDRSGVTKGAVYFHFSGKPALAEAVIAETIATWERMVAEVEARGVDPLRTLIAETDRIAELMTHDPVVRGGTRLLNDPLVPTRWADVLYRFAEDAARTQLVAAAAAGLLRPAVDITVLARSLITLVVGHNLVCERTGTPAALPRHFADMWRAMLPLIATDTWLHSWRDDGAGPG